MRSRAPLPGLVLFAAAAIAVVAAVRATGTWPASARGAASPAGTASSATGGESGAPAGGDVPAAPAAASASSAGAGSGGAAGSLARATGTEPSGVHVPLDASVVVHFDRPVAPDGVKLSVEPPAEGRASWPDARTFVFKPVAWHEAIRHHVKLEGPGIEPVAFEFSSLAPPPERIEPGGGARVTLTFDDGATRPAQVSELLDVLRKEGVSAIFFPIGRWAQAHPRLIERMVREGHRVCNHTWSHQNLRLPNLTEDAIRREIARGAGAGTCDLFRPPMRAYDPRVERIVADMGYTMYLWDVDSRDWEDLPAEDMVNRVLKRVRPGSVILFHMHAAETLKALPVVIARLRKAGYALAAPEDAGAPPP